MHEEFKSFKGLKVKRLSKEEQRSANFPGDTIVLCV